MTKPTGLFGYNDNNRALMCETSVKDFMGYVQYLNAMKGARDAREVYRDARK